MNEDNVLIVGGGAAGLSAALVLARACRWVVVIAAGRWAAAIAINNELVE